MVEIEKSDYVGRTCFATIVLVPIGWILFSVVRYLVENGGAFLDYICVLPLLAIFLAFLRVCVCCDILECKKSERVVVNAADSPINETSSYPDSYTGEAVVATPVFGEASNEVEPYAVAAVSYPIDDSDHSGGEIGLDPMVKRF